MKTICMNEEILRLTHQLKALLESDPLIIDLKRKEKAMENDKDVALLSMKQAEAAEWYYDAKKLYGDDAEETKKALKAYAEAKKNLESHPLVREYLLAYQKVRILYDGINKELFSYLNLEMCPNED